MTTRKTVHHLVRALEESGEEGVAPLVAKISAQAGAARELACRLSGICERRKSTQLALSYNSLVEIWPEIMRLARDSEKTMAYLNELFGA